MDWLDDKRDEVLEDDYFIDAQLMANSRQEALDLVGDDTFYPGSDDLEDEEEEFDLLRDDREERDEFEDELGFDEFLDPYEGEEEDY